MMNLNILVRVTLLALCMLNIANVEAKKAKQPDEPLSLTFEAEERKQKNVKKMTDADRIEAKNYAAVKKSLEVCTFEVSSFEDKRQNTETIGSTFAKPLMIAPVDLWLEDVSTSLLKNELISDAIGSRRIVIEPKLTRLYAYAQNMNIHGVSALHVDFREDGNLIASRQYRALGSTINWNNGDHEFLDAVNTSMKNVMPKLLFDLPEICNIPKN